MTISESTYLQPCDKHSKVNMKTTDLISEYFLLDFSHQRLSTSQQELKGLQTNDKAMVMATLGEGRVFANGPGGQGTIPGRVIPKTQKMVPDATLLNTWHYKVWIKGKVEQSKEWSRALPYIPV